MDEKRVPTTERLAKALEEVHAPKRMIDNARNGLYDDYKSDHATPTILLWQDAGSHKLGAEFLQRILDGEFDGQDWEAEEWANSPEGKDAFNKLTGGE